MSRAERRFQHKQLTAALDRENRRWSAQLVLVPRATWPADCGQSRVLRSRDFLVQEFPEQDGAVRLSINRTSVLPNGRWDDGISWDELQRLKREAGYAERYAVEVFPADADLVNVANMRHLWLLPEPPAFAWRDAR